MSRSEEIKTDAEVLTYDYVVNNFVSVKEPASIFRTANAFFPDPAKPKRIIGLNVSRRSLKNLDFLLTFEYLRFLDASENEISDISVLSLLTELEKIDLCFNCIDDIDPLSELLKIRKVSVLGNRLNRLPVSFSKMGIPLLWHDDRKEKGLVVGANPLPTKLTELLKTSGTTQAELLSVLSSQPIPRKLTNRPLKETRVLIVGPGGVGKTTLANVLQKSRQPPTGKPTVGVNVGSMTTLSNGERFLFKLWDFGGQTVQHSLHRIFFSNLSVFLLVIDCRKEDSPEAWLNHIKNFAPEAPIFIVLNKVDELEFDIDRASLLRKWPLIRGIFKTSAVTEAGIPQLLDELRKFSELAQCPKVTIEPKWDHARQEIIALRSLKPFVSHDEFDNVLTNAEIPECDWGKVKECFATIGDVLIQEVFDHVIIDPDWLSRTIMDVILSDSLTQARGELDYPEFLKVIEPNIRKFTSQGREPQKLVLHMMEQYDLCHVYRAHNDKVDKVLVPSAFSKQSPETSFIANAGIRLKIIFNFNPISILHKIIVRSLRDGKAVRNQAWFSGVVMTPSSDTRGTVECNESENAISINCSGTGCQKLASNVHNWIIDLASTDSIVGEFVSVQHLVESSSDCFVELERIRAHIEENQDYLHPNPRRMISVNNLKGLNDIGTSLVVKENRNEFGFRLES